MKMDLNKTAVLSLDLQTGIFAMVAGAEAAVPAATEMVATARKQGYFLAHVGLGFEPGYPEISPAHPRFNMLKERGLFLKGSETAQIHPSLYQPGDLIVYKHRVSAFAGNALLMILQSRGIENLVLFGISTSGIVLSTVRAASDLDFKCTVIKDACFDADPEVHRVLTEKIFANQATVMTAKEFQAG